MHFFYFRNFFFSALEDFGKKTYEKACCLYNIFSKCISNDTRLTKFTIWLLFPKKCRLFPLNVCFFSLWMSFPEKTTTIFLLYYSFQSYQSAASGKHCNAPGKACRSTLVVTTYWKLKVDIFCFCVFCFFKFARL